MSAPGWATDDLAEEWVEPSTSPTHEPSSEARALFGSIKGQGGAATAGVGGTIGTVGDKRGTLRSLGHAAPRGLPSFRSPSDNARIVSGHNSRPLVPSGEFLVPSGSGLLSPPSSRSSSEGQADPIAAGTCVVTDAVVDDRGGHLARGVKGKDIFGKNPLERMFEPPSPPVGSSDHMPPTPSPVGSGAPRSQQLEPRRVSHQYAPTRPSRLSKSMTPSSNGSTMMSEISRQEEDVMNHDMPDQSMATTVLEPEDAAEENEGAEEEGAEDGDRSQDMDISADLSLLQNGGTRFPFTFKAPRVLSSGTGTGSGSGTGTGSGSATIRGGTINSDHFDPGAHAERDGPNHSTMLERHLPPRAPGIAGLARNDNLRLFRGEYDTYTREHLSAIVDSIAIEASPSPERAGPSSSPEHAYDPQTPASSSDDMHYASDGWRNGKRQRLSPPSPDFAPRDWGKHGMDIMSKIKGRPLESITSASPGAETEQDQYPSVPLSPPLRPQPSSIRSAESAEIQKAGAEMAPGAKNKHRSNPSTASSGYLRAAEEIMANLRNRAVSESASASALESSLGTAERRPLSETDDNVYSSETDGHEYGQYAEQDQKEWTMQSNPSSSSAGFRSSPESDLASRTNTANLSGSLRRSIRSNRSLPRAFQHSPVHQYTHGPQAQFNPADLNRFVSSTTVPTSTTISTSFVKHAGPRGPKGRAANASGRGMMMIRPDEVSPDALQGLSVPSGMQYDPVAKRWMRTRPVVDLGRVSEGSESRLARSDESVDVFAGISEGSRSQSQSAGGTLRSQRSWGRERGDEQERDQDQVAEEEEEQREAGAEDDFNEDGSEIDGLQPPDLANTTITNAQWSDRSGNTSSATSSANSSVVLSGPIASSPPQEPIAIAGPIGDPSPPPAAPVNLNNSTARPIPHHANSAPAIMTPLPSHLAPKPVRSALRNVNGTAGNAETPGPKKTAVWADNLTPARIPAGLRSASRSVSFSDDKRIGQIEGLPKGLSGRRLSANSPLGAKEGDQVGKRDSAGDEGETPFSGGQGKAKAGNLFDMSGQSLMNSARTKRIQGLLDDMGDLSLDATPSKPSRVPESSLPALAPTPAPALRGPNAFAPPGSNATGIFASRRTLRRPRSFHDTDDFAQNQSQRLGRPGPGTTFMTDHSFAVAHDHLVKVITDVQPFEPYWDTLEDVDLSGKGLESVARLKDFLPGLDELKLDDNAISYLTGIPNGVRTLYAAGNRLTALASVDHLRNLQVLDLSRNQLDSVAQLSCLVHLRELKADYNRITSLSGIMHLDSLRKVSVRSNRIDTLDLGGSKWSKLESLEIAENGLGDIKCLEGLAGVNYLNLDDNDLTSISTATPLKALRTLRVSRNDLSQLDLSNFPKIRTVYADDNRLAHLQRSGGERSRLEALSLRSQRIKGVALAATEVRQLKRLYLSGNEIAPGVIPPMAALRYLEMAVCRFSAWPDLGHMPMLEVLNVNYNFLETLEGLKGAKALRKVMVVGNRLCEGTAEVAGWLEGLRIEELDLRMNPSTLGYYLPLFIPPPPLESAQGQGRLKAQSHPNKTGVVLGRPNGTLSASRMSQSFFHQPESENWQEMDREFRRNLPDTWYGRRLLYRGVVMRGLDGLRKLDGIEVSEGERRKAEALLSRAGK